MIWSLLLQWSSSLKLADLARFGMTELEMVGMQSSGGHGQPSLDGCDLTPKLFDENNKPADPLADICKL